MVLKWGIAGAGHISHDFCVSLTTLVPGYHEVVAVAARSRTRAREFARRHHIPRAYKHYTDLAEDPNVDVVYIGLINTKHMKVAKLCLKKKKNVLCEKPMCLNEADTTELIELARANKCFLMEGMKFRCFPLYTGLRNALRREKIGRVTSVSISFGFKLGDIDRVTNRHLGGGATLELGVHVLQLIRLVFGEAEPEDIRATGTLNNNGVDKSTVINMRFDDDQFAIVEVSTTELLENIARIKGTMGEIVVRTIFAYTRHIQKIPNFWRPTVLHLPCKVINYQFPFTDLRHNYKGSTGLSFEAEEVRLCIENGRLESPLFTHEDSKTIARWCDHILNTIGVSYQ